MPDDKSVEGKTDGGAEAQQRGEQAGEETEKGEQISRHAFHSTWEEIYQRELRNAAARKAYLSANQHKRTDCKRQTSCRSSMSSKGSCSKDGSSSSGYSSDTSGGSSSVDGEEWFGPECSKILSWVLNTLRKPQDHPLKLYFRRVHSFRCPDSQGVAECRGGVCDWCRGEGPLISQEFLRLPLLDVGCGGGQFLVRLRRCGFERLAGIDYSHFAIQLARSNLCGKRAGPASYSPGHICLRQADLRNLRASEAPDSLKGEQIGRTCICCCSKIRGEPNIGAHSGTGKTTNEEDSSPACTCEPATSLPPFPVVFDKGTFDVFWLMRTPELYVKCMHRLMPEYGLLFLTSCNCTVEDLDSLFCAKTDTSQQQDEQHKHEHDQQQQQEQQQIPSVRQQRERKTQLEAAQCAADAVSAGVPTTAECSVTGVGGLLRKSDNEDKVSNPKPKMPLFERVGLLPHRSFKFGGVEGQVVTSVLLRRL